MKRINFKLFYMSKSIKGYLINRIEKLGNKDYNHITFEDENKKFGDMLQSIVPEVGDRKKVKITIEILEK